MKKRYFYPSDHHKYLMKNIKRELAFSGQDFLTWQTKLRRRLVELLGGFPKEKIGLVIGDDGHRFYQDPSWMIFKEIIAHPH